MSGNDEFRHALQLSPLRNSSTATTTGDLVAEQLLHFGIDPGSAGGQALARLVSQLGAANCAAHELWEITTQTLSGLDRADRIAWFNAKRFACFQLAKVLDTLQNPLRATYQSLLAGSIPFEHSVQMKPGAASLRVLVVDENSGRMGSVTIPAAAMGANQ